MASLTDLIEAHILSLVEEGGGVAEIQRAFLADHFRCVPSQITYVLSSRFQPERGYVVESKRGGGGYIRVVKIELEDGKMCIRDRMYSRFLAIYYSLHMHCCLIFTTFFA